ncbi:centromere protein J [Trichomycterus rosablanca]|uniref:centromere protein J n=1 Tax=Trichomycterus rosablanca TaxID=2290929 RepID=UPI002F3609AD
MSSPAGLQPLSHFLSRWMQDSSRAGVFLDQSPGEVASVRSSCSSPGMEELLDDSFCSQFAPLPVSISSSCVSVDSVGHTQSRRDQESEKSSCDLDLVRHMGRKPQALIDRLEQLKQLQQRMQEQLKTHQLEQLQKLQDQHQTVLGIVQTTTGTESSVWNQDSSVEHKFSEHTGEEHHDLEGESLQSSMENQSVCRKENEPEQSDRPIRSGLGGKTFEEMLEEQLKMENEKLSKRSERPTEQNVKVKRPFLRQGEGLSRYMKGKAAAPSKNMAVKSNTKPTTDVDPSKSQGPVIRSHQSSEPKKPLPKSTSSTNVTIQRKTAVLNKDNFAQNKTSVPVTKTLPKAHVVWAQHNVRPEAQNISESRHQSRSNKQPESQQVVSSNVRKEMLSGQVHGTNEHGVQFAENSFDVWLKERGERWDKDQRRECVELGEFELLERAAHELSFSSNSSFINTLLQRDSRRLSSTPVKSPPKGTVPDQRCDNAASSMQPVVGRVLGPPVPPVDSAAVKEVAGTKQDEVRNESFEDEEESDSSLYSNTVFHQSTVGPNLQEPFSHGFQVSSLPYDKRSYQDRDGGGSPEGEETSHVDSTLVDRGQVEFDDDDTWNEPDDSIYSPPKLAIQSEKAPKRKVAFSKETESDRHIASPLHHKPEPPPTCQLVAKLFPSLKPQSCPPPPVQDAAEDTEQGAVQSRLLRERLVELEIEMERFRTENAALSRLRQENQEYKETLRKDRAEFEEKMESELSKWEEFKCEESKKLQRERKLFEKHAAAARARPDKQERDEIQSLKQQLNSLQEDLKKREARWSSTNSRLRQQLDALNAENATLRDQVRTLEKLRLNTWKTAETEQDREKKRGRSSTSSSSTNPRRTKSKSPSSSDRSSPPESNNSSPEVQNPTKTQAGSSNTRPSGWNWQKDPMPNLDGLVVSEAKSPDSQLTNNSGLSASEVDSPRPYTGQSETQQEEIMHTDGKIEKLLPDGGRLIVFPNGTRKEVSADGLSVKVTFFNGDIKHIMPDQRVIYYYAEAQTTHTTYPDGMEVLQFPNNQIEKHFLDGRKEITFPDQTVKNLYPDGREESVLTDGTIIQQNPDGSKQIQFNTGQHELHTSEFKRREYPDGTIKTVYSDGRQETRYPTGRVRLKDSQGRIITDTKT